MTPDLSQSIYILIGSTLIVYMILFLQIEVDNAVLFRYIYDFLPISFSINFSRYTIIFSSAGNC